MATINLLGIAMDLGAGRRGVDMGPSALRLAQLEPTLRSLGHSVRDHGNIDTPPLESLHDDHDPFHTHTIAEACSQAFTRLSAMNPQDFTITLGGDHAVSLASVAGLTKNKRSGVIWVDAHADLNTPETSPSGNIHGMPLAALLGYGDTRLLNIWGGGAVLEAEHVVLIGLRSIDEGERRFILEHNIRCYTMSDIDKRGMAAITEEVIACVAGLEHVHLSFDADVLDPKVAPGVGTPVPGGLSYREAHLLMEMFAAAQCIHSLDLVEVNPILDTRNETAEIMVEMASSLLGKAIL